MNENERKSGQDDQGNETLTNSPHKTAEKAKSPLRIVGILTTPLKTFDQLRVESPLRKLVENSTAVNFTSVDDSTLKNTEKSKNVDISTLNHIESFKSVDNHAKNAEVSTLNNIESSKKVDVSTPNQTESLKQVGFSTFRKAESFKKVELSKLNHTKNSKNVESSTLKTNDTSKDFDNGAYLAFEKPTLKALVTRKLLEFTKHPGTFDKHPLINSEGRLKGDALLKSLLSASTALSQKMITTTEVTDENLNLRKILYQADKAKCDDRDLDSSLPSATNPNDLLNDEDETRLVIDIPEEMNHKANRKSMPSLESFEDENKNMSKLLRPSTLDTTFVSTRPSMRQPTAAQDPQLPSSITYSLESSPVRGLSNSFKIDILSPALSQNDSSAMTDKFLRVGNLPSPKGSSLSPADEMNVISHEIDKQITKKTNEILELLKEFVNGSVDKAGFSVKMGEAGNLSSGDMISIAKKLIKRHKFEINPNQREFLRMKFLQFPTTSREIVNYFENLLPQLNHEKFIGLIKFYEIIIKEMLNLNRTKILQYLIDFMIIRKNAQLDLLNFNYQVASAPVVATPSTPTVAKYQLADSTQHLSERRNSKHDTSYNFIIRSDPIYLQAGSSFVTNHRDVITCRMIPRVQVRNFELRPFDNNILRGRRLGRRMVRTNEEEKLQSDFLRTRLHFVPSSEPATPTNQLRIARSPIVVESDTPPPSLPSDPPSPPQQRVVRDQHEVPIVHVGKPEEVVRLDIEESIPASSLGFTFQPKKRRADNPIEIAENVQITIHDIETLNQNGTEIIPTSIFKNAMMSRKPIDYPEDPLTAMKKCLPRGASHDETRTDKRAAPKRRQSCHERLITALKDNDENLITDSISQNYMEFLHAYEKKIKEQDDHKSVQEMEWKQHQYQHIVQQQQPPPPKRVRFAADQQNARAHADNQFLFAQQLQQQQFQNHLQTQAQQAAQNQQAQMLQMHSRRDQSPPNQNPPENHQRVQYPESALQNALKAHAPPINYQYYQHQFERELRERGFDHRIVNQIDPNRPLELVSTVPPERYHQHEQQRVHFVNHAPPKPRPVQEKLVQRVPPRNPHEDTTQAAMMTAAYNQLQSLHRDPQTLSSQQYAEHLKQLDHLKRAQPSAFTAYQRSLPPAEAEASHRKALEFFKNTQESSQIPLNVSPTQYQISSSSSREDSPNAYELVHQDQSLKRKLKYKSKSAKYVEPNQLSKPFFNPPNSTYYSEPFALTKNKPVPTTSPPANMIYHNQERARSPVPQRVAMDSKHYQWLVAQAHAQSIAMHGQPPQRPMPRPPVPVFPEPKANDGVSRLPPIHFERPPTDFLRKYYASNANFKHL